MPHELGLRTWALCITAALLLAGCSEGTSEGDESTDGTGVDEIDASVFDYDSSPEPVFREGLRIDLEDHDVRVTEVSFASPAGGEVTGYLARPDDEDPTAAMISMHGMPGDATGNLDILGVFACSGALAVAIDAPYARDEESRAGPDRPGGKGNWPLTFTETDREEQIQLVQDLRRTVDVLESLGADRITVDAISWSADPVMVLAGVEPRVDGYAIMVGSLVVDRFLLDGETVYPLRELEEDEADAWLAAMESASPLRFAQYATAPVLFQNNTGDVVSSRASAERMHAATGGDVEVVWHEGAPGPDGHDLTPAAVRRHVRWQAEILGLDADRVDTCLGPLLRSIPRQLG
jgi:dienelactone hydrolase